MTGYPGAMGGYPGVMGGYPGSYGQMPMMQRPYRSTEEKVDE